MTFMLSIAAEVCYRRSARSTAAIKSFNNHSVVHHSPPNLLNSTLPESFPGTASLRKRVAMVKTFSPVNDARIKASAVPNLRGISAA